MDPENPQLILYGHPFCGMVGPVRKVLDNAGVPYQYINIRQDPEAFALVCTINHGNASVPTLVFPDGSTLTEPTSKQLRQKLTSQGYDLPQHLVRNSYLAGTLTTPFNIFWITIFIYGILKLFGMF